MPFHNPALFARNETMMRSLRDLLGSYGLIDQPDQMSGYAADWSGVSPGLPLAVARPASTAEVSAVVRLCAEHGVPVVPQGGMTGMAGGAMSLGGELLLNLSRMNRVVDVDLLNQTMTVEAGCVLQQVKDAAAAAGAYFPLALGAQGSCQIGGNLSTNAGGVNVLRYGNARSAVLGLEVVLADGEVLNLMRGLRKDNTGYDLKQMFIGAEGTLGVITRAVLQLYPMTPASSTAWIAVDSPSAAVELLRHLRARVGERISSFELISRPMLELVLAHHQQGRDPLTEPHPWYVLTEWSDSMASLDLRAQMEHVLGEALEAGLVRDATIAESLAQVGQFWSLRERVTEAQRAEGAIVKHDIALPLSKVARFLDDAGAFIAATLAGARVIVFGHVGDGNLHYNVLQPRGAAAKDFELAMKAVSRRVYEMVSELGGSISAEHGLGQLKAQQVFALKSRTELRVMQALKRALDPQDLMNRGKLLPHPTERNP
ncbi:FAD-binding oxidoreductase [Paucibacter sp. PLA-PC-4]|uniref:FAD-binding oxidoreductase n=1 Tax=Paucibacter sp. PLA-PC-4 TaxID=2993655 RepID=UPI00224B0154|nr:FAD-binding oxidoreductase [Paucibacter sp. PLA-PC-4]MCX2863701.1 FAD-binding oxidoreductase [Paucibacter sp. PLA-PC-4]